MTLLNYWVTAGRAVVATDTRSITPRGGRLCESSKMIPLPHLNAVCAGRGNLDFLRAVVAVSQTFPPDGLDAMAEQMSVYLREAGAWLLKSTRSEWVSELQEVVIVGFSAAAGRITARHYVWDLHAATLVTEKRPRYSIAPADDRQALPDDLEPTSDEGLMELARAQCRAALALHPEGAFGGRLLIAEIDTGADGRGRTQLRDLGPIE